MDEQLPVCRSSLSIAGVAFDNRICYVCGYRMPYKPESYWGMLTLLPVHPPYERNLYHPVKCIRRNSV